METKIKDALQRAEDILKVIVDFSKQPENRPGTNNFDVCQAEKELARLFVKMIKDCSKKEVDTESDAVLFSYWLMENCELEEDNALWSYDGEDYSNEKLYTIWSSINLINEKINLANEILKAYMIKNFHKESYPYIDFVVEDRFLSEIKADVNVSIPEMTAQDLSDYAIEQIEQSSSKSRLIGF